MSTPDVALLAGRLDDHHAPETNGRMAICRRCGAVTDGPAGGHQPNKRQLDQLSAWLEGQSRIAGNLRASTRTDT
jgi:hypothetical protein